VAWTVRARTARPLRSHQCSTHSGTAPRFGHINDSYSNIFTAFSGERMFSPIGSNIVDLFFFVPGSNTPALSRGFGAVYTDVDLAENTAFEYFDVSGQSLGTFDTPAFNNGLSFLGVSFATPIVSHVRIRYGNSALGPNDGGGVDVAVMDDFIYADPPYDVEFTTYSAGGFSWEDQVRTAELLAEHKGPVVMSNQATKRIVSLYKRLKFKLAYLDAPRRISCTGDRSAAREVLATKNI
jgi:hypothetical protein